MKRISIHENKINIVFDIEDNGQIKLMHFSALPFNENDIWNEMFCPLVRIYNVILKELK